MNEIVAAVGVCRHGGVGLCVGGTLPCGHDLPATKPLRGVPAGTVAAARHHTAAGVS